MKYIFRVISTLGVILFTLFFFSSNSFAEETGFLSPATCITDGSSCENMQAQDSLYNTWTNTLTESITVTFTNSVLPKNAVIDDIQIKLRIRTSPNGGWTWIVHASQDNGVTYVPPLNCSSSTGLCRFNTPPKVFNSIATSTLTWLNNDPSHLITGEVLTSPQFSLKLFQSGGTKTTDIDTLLFNIRYHIEQSLKTPLIFIPGIGGSELQVVQDTNWAESDGHGGTYFHSYPAEEKVWVNTLKAALPGADDYFDVLRMESNGTVSTANIMTTASIVDAAYKPTIEFLTANGYELGTDLFLFPYDWRKDNDTYVPDLEQKINEIQQQTGTEKVDILAHSMGGLIARKYISDPSRAQDVRKLITLGTPHLGAVKFLKALMYGDCIKFEIGPVCGSISIIEMKDILQNMISGFELAPTRKYFDFYNNADRDHPYPFVDLRDIDNDGVTGIFNYDQTKMLLTNLGYNTSLFTPSEMFHTLDESLANTNGVDVTIIAGSGISTLGQIIEKVNIDYRGIAFPKRDLALINGDSTVPLFSASLEDPSHHISLLGNANVYYTKQTHGQLVIPGPGIELARNILLDYQQIPAGVSLSPFSFKGTAISSHSPVSLHVYDSQGNHTGPTVDGFEVTIPGSQYDMLDDETFIFLPEDGMYTIKLEATDKGSFDLVIKDYEDNINTKTTLYKNIPLTVDTKVETLLNTSSGESPPLAIDEDGNGSVEQLLSYSSQTTGDSTHDITPPVTAIQVHGSKGDNEWYTSSIVVSLTATDDTSGVVKTEYTLDNGISIDTYTSPFSITRDGIYTLKVKSIDAAGNEEVPHEQIIKIDTTPPEAKISIDLDKRNLIVQGADINSTTVAKQSSTPTEAMYTISDIAGNTLQLAVRDIDFGILDVFRIFSLKYNSSQPIVLNNNHFVALYQGLRTKTNLREQYFESSGNINIRISYDPKRNSSSIYTKDGKKLRLFEVKSGITILQLQTAQGKLEYTY